VWIDVEQNTEQWFDLRLGKVTGSTMSKVMANFGKAFGQPAKDLAVNLAVEQLGGVRQGSNYMNAHMERGHIEEPFARKFYEDEYFIDVENGGFYDNVLTGCSPDGRVGEDGLIEIKSAIPSVHYNRIRKNTFDSAYRWQLIFNMKEAERDWIDFISYCSSFPVETRLFVYRLKKDDFKKEYEMIDERLAEFFGMLKKVKGEINRTSVL
jgi:hypothetical protein